jgi:hypothetical protein
VIVIYKVDAGHGPARASIITTSKRPAMVPSERVLAAAFM